MKIVKIGIVSSNKKCKKKKNRFKFESVFLYTQTCLDLSINIL